MQQKNQPRSDQVGVSYTKVAILLETDKETEPRPVYRVYVDDILTCERQFVPRAPLYRLSEQLTFADDGRAVTIRIQNLYPTRGELRIKSVQALDGDTLEVLQDTIIGFNPSSLSFAVRLNRR